MTTCFTCQICDKTFKSERALNGHSRVHTSPAYNPPKIDTRITCPHTGRRVLPHLWEAYNARLRTCNNDRCGKVFEKKADTSGKFCSHSCAATVTNTERPPRTAEQNKKTSEGLKAYFASVGRGAPTISRKPKRERVFKSLKPFITNVRQNVCPTCSKSFWTRANAKRVNCSKTCSSEAHSKRMIKKIVGDSAGNFSLKQPDFHYKGVTVDCDSKMETAGVMYLIDVMGATSVERCTSILNYKDPDGGHHRFLPDFYVRIGDDRWLVEVKQIWRKSAGINNYNRFFDEKRQALNDFCEVKGLKPLWLDFDYDARFRRIYRKVIGV